MMKILHILCTDRLSGAEAVHLGILSKLKDENEVVYASPDGPVREAVEGAGVRFISCDTDSVRVLKELYKSEKPDVVHAADPRMSFKCALARVPFISHLHCNCPWMKGINPNSVALAFAARRARAVVAVSESIPDEFIFRKTMKGKLTVLPNAVDAERVRRLAAEECGGEYDLVFTGRLEEIKRPTLFLEIFEKLKEQKPDATAVMIGDGAMRRDVEKYINDRRIGGGTLTGYDPNPYRYMARSKVMVVTSSSEGFGLVAVEAMALGVPVIAFPAGGVTKIADEGGFIAGTADEAVSEAYMLLSDAAEYGAVSRRALGASEKYTDTDGYIEKIKEIYAACK